MTTSKLHLPSSPSNPKREDRGLQRSQTERTRSVPSAMTSSPRQLPFCAYPRAWDVAQHGLQPLPENLRKADFTRAQPYRSRQYRAEPAACLSPGQVMQMARVVGESFARREPMTRHLQLPRLPPAGVMEAIHSDPFGQAIFGSWTKANLMTWFIRQFILTDPTSPRSAIQLDEAALKQSLAILDGSGQVIGGAFNGPMPILDEPPPMRQGDPILHTVLEFLEPVLDLLWHQDAESVAALSAQYPAFREACQEGRVGHHFMIARSDALPKEEAFELVAASAVHFQALGYAYMLVEASNPWTGAACEMLGGARVHFAPYQVRQTVHKSAAPLEGVVTSPNGFLSDKDSGCMFYVICLS